jgi:hypothetical protein
MNNGLTAAFFNVLVIAGTQLAERDWEKRLVFWMAQHDQSLVGLGTVGFDVADMGWTIDDFSRQKRFVLSLIEAAATGWVWDKLPFKPREDWLPDSLRHFGMLVHDFEPSGIKASGITWRPSDLPTHGICEIHQAYLHERGCIICNDAPIGTPPQLCPHRGETK